MTDTKFTPGPWVMRRIGNVSIDRKDWGAKPMVTTKPPVATVGGDGPEERLANTYLIAAAPDLYEALEATERLFRCGLLNAPGEEMERVRNLRLAALSKARGER